MPVSPGFNTVPPLRRDRLAAAAIAGLFLLIAVVAAAYGLIVVLAATKEILVAVIAGAVALLSTVFAYVFTRAKDLEMAAIQKQRELELAAVNKRRELELAERKVKQENYYRILERLSTYIYEPRAGSDTFATAFLQTWVSGSIAVVEAIDAFQKNPSYPALDALLHAMRDDLTLEGEGSDHFRLSVSTSGLFPAPEPIRGLGPGINKSALRQSFSSRSDEDDA